MMLAFIQLACIEVILFTYFFSEDSFRKMWNMFQHSLCVWLGKNKQQRNFCAVCHVVLCGSDSTQFLWTTLYTSRHQTHFPTSSTSFWEAFSKEARFCSLWQKC